MEKPFVMRYNIPKKRGGIVIRVTLTNEILKRISEIDENRFSLSTIELPAVTKNRLRKNSKKKSSYASNKIEGNPLTEQQANEAIDSDSHKHFLKPEQEVRNYFLALNFLEEKLKKKEHLSKDMLLKQFLPVYSKRNGRGSLYRRMRNIQDILCYYHAYD